MFFFNKLRNKIKLLAILTLVFIIASFLIFKYINLNSETKINYILEEQKINLKNQYNSMLYHKNRSSFIIINMLKRYKKGKVIELFSKASKTNNKEELDKYREELYSITKCKYDNIKQRGVSNLHFVFKNNITFLRLHKPNQFDDNLTTIRPDIAYVNKNKKTIKGFSAGKTNHAFRNIFPIYNKQKEYIGAIDISYPSELFQNTLLDSNNIHNHFLINKKVFNSKKWSREDSEVKYIPSYENRSYLLTVTKEKGKKRYIIDDKIKLKPYLSIIDEKMSYCEPFVLSTKYDDNYQALSFYPIKSNVTKEISAWIVSCIDKQEISTIKDNEIIIKILSISILIFILIFIYILICQKTILRKKVQEKTIFLEELNQNLENKINKRTEQLKSANIQLEDILKSADFGYWKLDLKNNYLEVNDKWLDMIGLQRGEFNNSFKELKERIHPSDIKNSYTIIQNAFLNNKSFNIEFRVKHKNGKYIWIETSGSAIEYDKDNKPTKVYGVNKSIESKKEKEHILQNQNKVDAISNMVLNLAHQWRQPLSIISTSTSGLALQLKMLGSLSNEQINNCSNIVINNVNYLTKTIESFSDFIYNKDYITGLCSVKILVDEIKEEIKEKLLKNNITLIVEVKNNFEINTNKNILIKAILNIINNSIEILEKNDNKEKLIFIETNQIDNFNTISIKDNGNGIDEKILDKIFEPYFTTKHKSIGVGLSLYMTYQIIKQLNGTINSNNVFFTYKNQNYNGAEFIIKFNNKKI